MIDRLRQRFIAIAMLSVLLVLCVITALINLWSYQRLCDGADETLRLIAENDGHFPRQPKDRTNIQHPEAYMDGLQRGGHRDLRPDQSPEAPFSTRYFTVTLDGDGTDLVVNTGSIAAVSTSEAVAMALDVLTKGRESGFSDIYRYRTELEGERTRVIFLDCRKELYTLRGFFVNSIWVDLVGFAAVSLLILSFSKAAVRPVAQSYEKQKRFITDAGHELKTPLAVIAANVEVLELESGESQWTASIHSQIGRLTRLTGQLTALAAMEEPEQLVAFSDFDLSETVRETAEAMEALAVSKGHLLIMQIEPGIRLRGNVQTIGQLVGILLDNAAKYALPEGEILLALTRQGKGVRLTVQNPAEGFTPGEQAQLFERFYRADTSRSRESGGHGLGLSIAQAIAKIHRAKIAADSPDGKNLRITVKF